MQSLSNPAPIHIFKFHGAVHLLVQNSSQDWGQIWVMISGNQVGRLFIRTRYFGRGFVWCRLVGELSSAFLQENTEPTTFKEKA